MRGVPYCFITPLAVVANFYFAFAGAACAPESSCAFQNRSNFVVGSLNLAQDEFSPFRSERAPAQLDLLANKSDFDLICLQELWDRPLRSRFVDSLSFKYPHVSFFDMVTPDPCPAGVPACNEAELRSIGRCLLGPPCNNVALSSLEKVSCVVRNCFGDSPQNISSRCDQCLSFLDSGLSIERRLTNCAGLIETPDDSGEFSSCQMIFNNSLDTVILSKHPIVQSNFMRYRLSPVWIQGAHHARVSVNSSIIDVFCTHPIADAPLVDFESTNLDQAQELVEIVNRVQQSSDGTTGLTIVLGDFNAGPEIDQDDTSNPSLDSDVEAIFRRSFEYLNNTSGWQNALLSTGTRTCTWCPNSNELATRDPLLIDHIFVINHDSNNCFESASLFANESTVQVSSQPNPVPLSDHYGVRASFCLN